MIVDDITYNETDGTYDSSIFTVEKNKDFSRAYRAKKNVQNYVFADGTAEKSIERKFAEDMDLDDKVVVYTKLPRGFQNTCWKLCARLGHCIPEGDGKAYLFHC